MRASNSSPPRHLELRPWRSTPGRRLVLARQLLENGDLDAAAAEVDSALRANPELPTARLIKGCLQLRRGDSAGAVAQLELAVRLDRHLAEAWLALAEALHDEGRYGDVLAAAERAMARPDLVARGHHRRGLALAALDQEDEALAAYEAAVRVDADLGEAQLDLARALRRAGYRRRAEYHARLAKEVLPASVEPGLLTAQLCLDRGEPDVAIREYLGATRAFPTSVKAFVAMAELFYEQGALPQAFNLFTAALFRNPDDVAARRGIGRVYLREQRYPEAESSFLIAAAAAASEANPAMCTFAAATEESVPDAIRFGDVLAWFGEGSQALELYRERLGNVAGGFFAAAARLGIAAVLLERRDHEGALAELEQAMEQGAPMVECRRLMAACQFHLGDHAAARSSLSLVLAAEPSATSYFNRGETLRALGDEAGATADFAAALELDPDCAPARARLDLLQGRMKQGAARKLLWASVEPPVPEEPLVAVFADDGGQLLLPASTSEPIVRVAEGDIETPDGARFVIKGREDLLVIDPCSILPERRSAPRALAAPGVGADHELLVYGRGAERIGLLVRRAGSRFRQRAAFAGGPGRAGVSHTVLLRDRVVEVVDFDRVRARAAAARDAVA